jgi:hypothetical protein
MRLLGRIDRGRVTQGPSDVSERVMVTARPNVNRHITGQISTEVKK